MSHLNSVWNAAATAYLVVLPCLWWVGRSQDEALGVAYPVATVALMGLSLAVAKRGVRSDLLLWLLGGVVASSLFHWPTQGFPALVLYAGLALMAWMALVMAAPSAAWIEQRLVWMAVANMAMAMVQAAGMDPIFVTTSLTGFFATKSQLGLLMALVSPFVSRPIQLGCFLTAVVCGSWTGAWLIAGWWAWQRLTPRFRLMALASCAVGGIAGYLTGWPCVVSRLLPRLSVWPVVIGQSVWSPLWGYGLGAWEATMPWDVGPWVYNAYLSAWHIGGVLLLGPILWVVWQVWRSEPSTTRTALLMLAVAALVQTPWHHLRFIIVTVALGACWHLRRSDETPAVAV